MRMIKVAGCTVIAVAWLVGCAVEQPPETSVATSHGMNMQGMNMQGMNMQGMNMQGMNMQGFAFDGATLSAVRLTNVQIIKGELVASRANQVVRGTALVGTQLVAHAVSAATPPTVVDVPYRITAITPELATHDPTHTGSTFLYTLEQYRADTETWVPACEPDQNGRRAAIPIAATWNARGDRVESATSFTFACTTGVIAKCYRWGYRPWLSGYGGADMPGIHQTCTRVARADYCGDGTSHTHEGTWINLWDRLPAPGPIQRHGLLPPLGMLFEAGWNRDGAVCLSRARWLLDDTLAQLCPDRLIPPGLLGGTVCDTVAEVLGYDGNALLFNESYLSLF